MGNVVYWSARPKVAVSDLIDWKISSCYAAEKVTEENGKRTASGKTYDLIKVRELQTYFQIIFKFSTLYFKKTHCKAGDPVNVGFGNTNGDFNHKSFVFNRDDQNLRIFCKAKLCLKTETDCFDKKEACADNYSA